MLLAKPGVRRSRLDHRGWKLSASVDSEIAIRCGGDGRCSGAINKNFIVASAQPSSPLGHAVNSAMKDPAYTWIKPSRLSWAKCDAVTAFQCGKVNLMKSLN